MYLNFDTVEAFAIKRNPKLSFPFLKENGELLSLAVNAGFLIEPRAIELYRDFYNAAFKLTYCYPQYYRFILGITLDLEEAGLSGEQSLKIIDYTTEKNLLKFDSSDVRRLETLHMISTKREWCAYERQLYDGIISRIEDFIAQPVQFTKFNKPLFYDLTHILFFLTDFGRKSCPLENDPLPCLMNVGLLALLDNDADLLSEVGLCLYYLGHKIPPYWDSYIKQSLSEMCISYDGTVASALNPSVDEYHLYLVQNGYMAVCHKSAFQDRFGSKTPSFYVEDAAESLLAKLSDVAHKVHVSASTCAFSLARFTENFTACEKSHWNNSLRSHADAASVIYGFSGFETV